MLEILKLFWHKIQTTLLSRTSNFRFKKLVHALLYKICVSYCTLFWDDIKIIWDDNIVYFFNWEKKMVWTNKKFVYLIFINKLLWYHPKIRYENIIQRDKNKFQQQINAVTKIDLYGYCNCNPGQLPDRLQS